MEFMVQADRLPPPKAGPHLHIDKEWGLVFGVDALVGRVSQPCATGDTVDAPRAFPLSQS